MKVLASKEGTYGIWHIYVPDLEVSTKAFIEQDVIKEALHLIADMGGKQLDADDLDIQVVSYSEIYMYESGAKTWQEFKPAS